MALPATGAGGQRCGVIVGATDWQRLRGGTGPQGCSAQRWQLDMASKQSGTKPNLVAKILATKFGFVPDCLVLKHSSMWRNIRLILVLFRHIMAYNQKSVSCHAIGSWPRAIIPWGLNEMVDILPMTFWNAFSWMKMLELQWEFTSNYSWVSNCQYWSRYWLGTKQAKAITWTDVDLCHHMASLGHNELLCF